MSLHRQPNPEVTHRHSPPPRRTSGPCSINPPWGFPKRVRCIDCNGDFGIRVATREAEPPFHRCARCACRRLEAEIAAGRRPAIVVRERGNRRPPKEPAPPAVEIFYSPRFEKPGCRHPLRLSLEQYERLPRIARKQYERVEVPIS